MHWGWKIFLFRALDAGTLWKEQNWQFSGAIMNFTGKFGQINITDKRKTQRIIAPVPVLLTGQLFLHSWRHFLGLHRSELTMAIRVNRSAMALPLYPLIQIRSEQSGARRKREKGKERRASERKNLIFLLRWRGEKKP